ncbi:putative P450 monooxygenase [Cladophialophora carrionii]|uniref:Putative P450 monooxygenase n=1 Tax=Cladophialophora carrionii TaxID=86049 RepID=A0A1C1CBM9_9EURO|nr:putative P450 monooxygenase [Cladophialophora carrionii]
MASFVTPALFPWLIAAFLVGYAVRTYYSYQKLSHFKGPPVAAVSSFWLAWQAVNARMPVAQKEALRRYGSPARIGPSLLVTDDPELLRHMSAPRSKWTRAAWYDGMKLDPRVNNIFSERDERRHAEMRSKMIGAYSGKEVETLESDIDENLQRLLTLIKQEYNGKPLDMALLASYFTLDVLSQIAFGDAFGFVQANEDLYDFNKLANEKFSIIELIVNHDFPRKLIQSQLMQKLMAPKGTDKFGQGRITGIAQKAVAERYRPNAKIKRDMLGHFIAKGLSQTQSEAESQLQIIAGSDSTAGALRITMMMLVGNPVAYGRLVADVDQAIVDGKISYPIVRYSEALEIEFLTACIWEGIRLYPPLFGLQSKLAPPEGETVNGVYYPPGTQVAFCCEGVGRRRDIFGEDADLYRPDRWLHPDPKLLRNFDWALADPVKGAISIAHGIWVQEKMMLVAWPRRI